ncbi:MAG: hypothetical protein U5O15_08060 [Candidatus Krumholzibacteriota bacterium]|nr:hypothetical protein [Candidatus Krumholzibacteriota bacterium]
MSHIREMLCERLARIIMEQYLNKFIDVLLVGIGGILGYFLRSFIDNWSKRKDRSEQIKIEDFRKQRDLLIEFLGEYQTDFHKLHNVGHQYDFDWRVEKSCKIYDWVSANKYIFPKNIHFNFNRIANYAGKMIHESWLEEMKKPFHFKIVYKDFSVLENYLEELNLAMRK